MKGKLRFLVVGVLSLALAAPSSWAQLKTRNVVLIVSDGLRWQEVFAGAEEDLLNDKEGGSWLSDEELRKRYWRATPAERREALFPFLWGTVAKQGQIFGNQALGSIARVSTARRFPIRDTTR